MGLKKLHQFINFLKELIMIKLTRTSEKEIWIDHRKIVSMHVKNSPNQATYVDLGRDGNFIVKESPDKIINTIRDWEQGKH